jgi:thiol-disulfide isomerase/thioredoxin
VIATEGILPGSDHGTAAFTFWVEKQTGLIRKSIERREGELYPSDPGGRYTSKAERVYSIIVLNPSSFPDGAFTFDPPSNAVLVEQFIEHCCDEAVGQPIPAISVKDAGGKEVSLQSLQGKPLLLDFWATWCKPCREALPTLEKLYDEYKDKGLVLLSLDQDEDPQKAADFWAKNKMPWPNYHLDRQAGSKLPRHGIPYFVLVDASGKVVFSRNGLEEKELQAALAGLEWPGTAPSAQ